MIKLSDKPLDRRIRRTQLSLQNALYDLIRVRDWDEISIQMICESANIARSSFYLHYSNKAELLDEMFARAFATTRSEILSTQTAAGEFASLLWLVRHSAEMPQRLRMTMSKGGDVIFHRFQSAIEQVVLEEMQLRYGLNLPEAATFIVAGALALIARAPGGLQSENVLSGQLASLAHGAMMAAAKASGGKSNEMM